MQFIKHDLGELSSGEMVEVVITAAANVRLMDKENFLKYRSLHRFRDYGGYVTHSPFRTSIPYAGHWFVAVDLAGYAGTVGSSARVLESDLEPAVELQ